MLMESVILLSNGQLFSEKTNITVMEILGLILFQLITIYIKSWNQVTIPCLENSNKNEEKEKTDLRAKFGNGGVDLFPRRIRKAWTGEAAYGKSRLDLDIAWWLSLLSKWQ